MARRDAPEGARAGAAAPGAGGTDAVAPAVVAVVVTCDPGEWFEESLAAIAAQDYPNLSVLVIDASSATDVGSRVAAVVPGAYVRRVAAGMSYTAAANEVLTMVEGADFYLLCHDDIAPEPDALRLMVEELFRSNAAIVGPKLLQWDDPTRLLQVGLGSDKAGYTIGGVERGELDQEQHDAVRDVFVIPSACTLVRADLFAVLGGFDEAIVGVAEDLDLCWRAQLLGGRVMIVPGARVRHLEAMQRALRPPGAGLAAHIAGPDAERPRARLQPLESRNRLRVVLVSYSRFHLVRVLPQIAVLAVAQVVYALVRGRPARAAALAQAWWWNLRRLPDVAAARKRLRAKRAVPDSAIRRSQVRGSARFAGFVRRQMLRRERAAPTRRDWSSSWRGARPPAAVGAAVAIVLLIGSRHLLGGLPAVGDFAPLPGATRLLGLFASGWRATGVGAEAAAPPAFAFLGIAGLVLGGAVGLVHTLVTLGAIPVGLLGAYRLARPVGATRVRLACLLVYAAVPLPYNALARGRWAGLLAYALAPWVLAALARAVNAEPFRRRQHRPLALDAAALGVPLAVAVALAPPLWAVVVLMTVGLAIGGILTRQPTRQAFAVGGGAVVAATVLLVPWSIDLFADGGARLLGPVATVDGSVSLGEALRFQTGPVGAAPLGWAFLAAALLPVMIGGGWRLTWATRVWMVALVAWLVTWAGGRGWFGIPMPAADVTLAPAAAAVALLVALGVAGLRTDLPGYRFGLRQALSVGATLAVAAGVLPVVGAAANGRWHLPPRDFNSLLSWMADQRAEGSFRVLWLGSPEVLPLHGWAVAEGLAYATSIDGPPDATALWPGPERGATRRIASAVDAARRGGTARLGRRLAPMGVRYIVTVDRAAPDAGLLSPLRADLTAGLAAQLDLRVVAPGPEMIVYENAAWGPVRAVLTDEQAVASRGSEPVDLAGADPVLRGVRSPTHFTGRVGADRTVSVAEAASSRWQLTVDGRRADRYTAFGWANGYEVDQAGAATLRYRTSPLRWAAIVVQLGLWVLTIRWLIRRRDRRAVATPDQAEAAEPLEPAGPTP